MPSIQRSTLFGKLNPLAYKALEGATVFCKMRGNPYVELLHWINQIFQTQDTDLHHIARHFSLDASRLAADLTAALDRLPRGATAINDFSPHIENATQQAWTYSSLLFGENSIRTGHLLLALISTPSLRSLLLQFSPEFGKVKEQALTDNFADITSGSPEARMSSPASDATGGAAPGEASGAMSPAQLGKQEALNRYTTDLTAQAREGKMDPILCREDEIRQIVDILMRRRQNNPILTGEAGVGKTAVIEGFAQRIVKGDVPPSLRDVTLRSLDIGLLQAGASMKGEFEQRLRQVIDEVQASPTPIILFIDEAHTLIGAGGAAGTGDAANLLKPALARGTLRTVAATTWAEYKKHIEKDPALTRRFQVVKVDEPDEAAAIAMIRGLAPVLEKHHRVQVLDSAVEAAVKLSHRYIPSRQLPDKAVSLIDTACARVAVSQHATPAEIDDTRQRIIIEEAELEILARESKLGADHAERETRLRKNLEDDKTHLAKLEADWTKEKELVEKIIALRRQVTEAQKEETPATPGQSDPSTQSDQSEKKTGKKSKKKKSAKKSAKSAPAKTATPADPLIAELRDLETQLSALQGETPLILPSVNDQAVAAVVADWTGIPVGRMVKNEIQSVLNLADNLEKRIIGQRHALEAIARRIQTSRASLDNPSKPIGVFMLAGTSGVGKTETALALAEVLYGGEQNVITINMSEFQEAHTVSTLKGAPPGYVGYGEGGILTEAVRRRPYSIVLLDEVEKAHPDVHEIFFQVFDKGWMEDGEGRLIDFKNTIILLTTNVGTDIITNLCKDPELMPDADGIAKALRPALLKTFPAALLGRLVTIPYFPLSDEMLRAIIRLQLGRIVRRIAANRGIALTYTDDVVALIASRCTENESGGRMVDAILTQTLLPDISREILTRLMEGRNIKTITVETKDSAFVYNYKE
ncbi:type VI secretion system protein VasG [Ereboglobus sp. PH5-10]|uniref:type VI secretion system ATPase TssH n=1 Tax=Ereboglobus sp. PH5-10 TaxID=2940629 RepID=UPI002404AE14|nr:type VI secretion system ATPase TssH [Ereboglobus sp. PH5-10]MDF9826566.1 type VI secretion system protein VasG [Ereboglobus sp. PH5-10]